MYGMHVLPKSEAATRVVVALLATVSALAFQDSSPSEGVWLITSQESAAIENAAAMLPWQMQLPVRAIPVIVDKKDGPLVEIVEPATAALSGPFDLNVRFIAQAGPVDLSSVQLSGSKWMMGRFLGRLDLLPRIKPHLTEDGFALRRVMLPRGKYRIRLAVKDQQGNESSGDVILEILPNT